MKKMKIRGKLIVSFMIVILLASIPIIFSLNRLRNAENEYSKIIQDYGFSQGDIGKAMLDFKAKYGFRPQVVKHLEENENA